MKKVIKTIELYETTDGATFHTECEAVNHEIILKQKEYEKITNNSLREEVNKLLILVEKTNNESSTSATRVLHEDLVAFLLKTDFEVNDDYNNSEDYYDSGC